MFILNNEIDHFLPAILVTVLCLQVRKLLFCLLIGVMNPFLVHVSGKHYIREIYGFGWFM